MAVTQIADIYVPAVVAPLVNDRFLLKSAIIRSGAVTQDALIASNIAKGHAFEVPFRKEISSHTANVSSDDPAVIAAAQKLDYGFTRVAPLNRNGRWGAADLARIVAGDDPLAAVGNQLGDFWAKEVQGSFLSMLTGIFADNIANDASDMFFDVSIATGTVSSANKASRDAFIEAKATAGDRRQDFSLCFMHSSVAKYLEKTDTTSFEKPSAAMPFKAYNGMIVIEDDSIAITGATGYKASTIYCVAAGAIGYDFSSQGLIAEESEREAAGGNGGGVEYIYSRRRYAFAPNGISFLSITNPTDAQLATAANWDRKVGRKNVGLAALKVNI